MVTQSSHALSRRTSAARIALLYLLFATLWIYASDRTLALFVENEQWLSWLGTVKGIAYVVATALLLYILLRNWSGQEDLNLSTPAAPSRYWLAIVFFFLIILVPLLAYSVGRVEGPRIRAQAFGNLSAVAELKTDQIEEWLAERRGDATILMASSGFVKEFERWRDTGDPLAYSALMQRISALKRAHHYQVELVDPRKNTLDAVQRTLLAQALASGRLAMDGLRHDSAGRIWLEMMIPVIRHDANKSTAVGALLVRAAAEDYLFPLIQRWPGPSPSAETLLVRRDGDNILFLNQLRHAKNTALSFRLPLSSPTLPAAQAIRAGKVQTFEGLDYRGVDVLSALRPVAGTDWFLVAKIDRSEVMRPLTTLVAWVSLVSFAGIVAMAIALTMLWRQQQRAQHLQLIAQSREALKKSQGQLRTFIEQAPTSMAMLDRDLNYIATSERWIAEHGGQHADLIGRSLYQAHPDISDKWKQAHRDAMNGAFLKSDNDLWIRADGSRHWLRWAVYPWTNETGETGGIIISTEDVTERKRAEEALRISEEKFSLAFNANPAAIALTRLEDGLFLDVNDTWMKMTGRTREETIGRSARTIAIWPTPEAAAQFVEQLRATGTLRGWEQAFLKKSGETFIAELSAQLLTVDDEPVILSTLIDITARKRAELALRTSQQRLAGLIDSAMDAIIAVDEEQKIRLFNPAAEQMFGLASNEALGQPLARLIPPSSRQAHATHIHEFGLTGITTRNVTSLGSLRGLRANGTEFPIEASISQIELPEGKLFTVILRDITERVGAEAALRASKERYRALVEQAADGIFVSDSQGHYSDVNSAGCRLLGYSRDELLQLSIADVIEPHEIPRIGPEVLRLAGGAVAISEWQFRRKDGSVFPGEVHARQLPDGRLQAILRDITERKAAERALREREADLNRAQAVGHIGSWRLDVTRNELTWSEETHRIFEVPLGTPMNYEFFLATVHPDDRAYVDREWQAGMRGKPYDIEHRLLVNGKTKWVREKAELEYDAEGSLLGGFGTTQDITERKMTEESLQWQLRLTKAITDSAVDAIFVTDQQGRVTFVNAEAERTYGYSVQEMAGQVLHDLIHHHHPDGRPYPFNECPNCRIYRSGESVRLSEAMFYRRDGTPLVVACSNAPLEIEGVSMGAVLVAHDITSLKQSEEALQEANKRKDEFLALLAHELRNPMAVTATAAFLLQTKGLSDPEICRWAAATITNQTELLKQLVDDLLDVERVNRGKIALIRTRLDLAQLIARFVKEREALIAKRKQHLSLSIVARPLWVEADPARLTQVISNLVDNASKFTPEDGHIDLSLAREGDEAVIRVRDTGRGIPPKLLPHIFEIFTQGQVSLARDEGGLGLGLALVKGLVELHGGRVSAASAGPDKGAEFTVRLPAQADMRPATPESAAPRANIARKRRILIGEDNAMAAEGLKHVLQGAGHEVRVTRDGAEALAAAKEDPPEIAIFDIGLPKMNGYELARDLRKLPDGDRLLLIALTGYGKDQDRLQSKQAGFDYHLTKPANLRQLLEIIDTWNPAEVA